MIDPTKIDYGQVAQVAQHGSPVIMQAVGRVFGLGPEERMALAGDGFGVPTWAWVVLGAGAGFIVGVRVYKKWPRSMPKLIAGD